MLVMKNVNNWLILKNKYSEHIFSYHKVFVDRLTGKYFSFRFITFKIRNLNEVMLEFLYPLIFISKLRDKLIKKNYITNKYFFNIKLYPLQDKSINTMYNLCKTDEKKTMNVVEDELLQANLKDRKLYITTLGLKQKNFITNMLKLQDQEKNGLSPGDFSEKQLFYNKSKRIMISDFDGKSTKRDELSKNFSLFHAANMGHERRNLTLETPELEYSYLMPKMFVDKDLMPVGSEVGGNKTLKSIVDNIAKPLQKTPGSFHEQNAMNVSRMADQVYHLIEKKIQVEKERSGRWC